MVIGLVAAALVLPQTAHASPTYRFVASYRLPAQPGGVGDISCVAANDCVIVGGDLAQTFDGHTATPIPGLDGTGENWFSVTCAKLGTCMMIGLNGSKFVSALRATETSAWTRATIAPPANNINYGNLGRVSCASATFCLAVTNYEGLGVVWHWDGAQWHRSSLHPSTSSSFQYYGVSCPGAFECVVTGYRWVGAPQRAVAFRAVLDGNTWHVANLPGNGGFIGAEADQVSCWAVHHCLIDGFVGPDVAAWRWSGGDFVRIAGFTLTNGEILQSLSCTAASFCVAGGEGAGAQGAPPFVLLWDGTSWTKIGIHLAHFGQPSDTKDVAPVAVSCSAAYSCWLTAQSYDEQTQEHADVIDRLVAT